MLTSRAEGISNSPVATELRLRPLRDTDEDAFVAAHQIMRGDDFEFGLGFDPAAPWGDYLRRVDDQRTGVCVPSGWVPATFLIAEVGGDLVGRVSIRHELNEHLAHFGGHIGYGVLPAHRRRGYATEILRQSLIIARAAGVDRILITCDDDNVGSIKVIEACGGKHSSTMPGFSGATDLRHYWIG